MDIITGRRLRLHRPKRALQCALIRAQAHLDCTLVRGIRCDDRFTSCRHAQPRRSIAFKSLENLAFDGAEPGDAAAGSGAALYSGHGESREFRHLLVQTDEGDNEYVLCHGLCLDHLEERGHGPLSRAESVAFVEELLGPAARPPHLLAVGWRPGDVAVWDNRTTQHSVTPTHRNGTDPGYATLAETRLMTRTAMQPSWVPTV